MAAADEFLDLARASSLFVPVSRKRTRFSCRLCGDEWEVATAPLRGPEWRLVPPWPPEPLTTVVHRERLERRAAGALAVTFPTDAARELDAILAAIGAITAPLEERAGALEEIRVTVGPRLRVEGPLETVYRKRWKLGRIDRAWWGLRAARGERAVEIEAVRKWSRRQPFGFEGELHLLVVNPRTRAIRVGHREEFGA